MELPPSTLWLHKRVDGIDNIFKTLSFPTELDPLSKKLGKTIFVTFTQAENNRAFAYHCICDLCHDKVDDGSSSSIEDSSGPDIDNSLTYQSPTDSGYSPKYLADEQSK